MRCVTCASESDLSSPSQTFSATVSVSNKLKCWNTMLMPSARACCGLRMSTTPPFQRTSPASGRTVP